MPLDHILLGAYMNKGWLEVYKNFSGKSTSLLSSTCPISLNNPVSAPIARVLSDTARNKSVYPWISLPKWPLSRQSSTTPWPSTLRNCLSRVKGMRRGCVRWVISPRGTACGRIWFRVRCQNGRFMCLRARNRFWKRLPISVGSRIRRIIWESSNSWGTPLWSARANRPKDPPKCISKDHSNMNINFSDPSKGFRRKISSIQGHFFSCLSKVSRIHMVKSE